MRRYTVKVNDAFHTIDVEETASNTYQVHLGESRLVEVTLVDHQDLPQATITPAVEIGRVQKAGSVAPDPPGKARPSSEPAPARKPTRPPVSDPSGVTAPMPGVVLSLEVSEGSPVRRGQTLLVLEAMKMRNEIKAEREGKVARLAVGVGDQVKHGDLLVEFES